MTNPLISVIIPAWNAASSLSLCLQALNNQTIDKDLYEVIVIDNGSTDSTAATALSFPFVELVSESRPGSYMARNKGLLSAKGDYVAFTDADCIPAENWLEMAIKAVTQHSDAAVLGGKVELFGLPGANETALDYEYLFAFNQHSNIAAGLCVTANWVSPKAKVVEMKGFNPNLKSGGDTDLSSRISAKGGILKYAPEMVVLHPARGSLSELAQKTRRVIGGRWQKRTTST